MYQSENHIKGILFEDLNYSRLTELVTPFGDTFLKVADFQFKYVKKCLKKKRYDEIFYGSNIASPLGQFCRLSLDSHREVFTNKRSTMKCLQIIYSEPVKEFTLFSSFRFYMRFPQVIQIYS